jgi:hypothetical protein
MNTHKPALACAHCGEPVVWSRLLEEHYCTSCRDTEVVEKPCDCAECMTDRFQAMADRVAAEVDAMIAAWRPLQ